MTMKTFNTPAIDVLKFEVEDVIADADSTIDPDQTERG